MMSLLTDTIVAPTLVKLYVDMQNTWKETLTEPVVVEYTATARASQFKFHLNTVTEENILQKAVKPLDTFEYTIMPGI